MGRNVMPEANLVLLEFIVVMWFARYNGISNNGHIGPSHFVLCREVVLSSEIKH